MSIESPVPRAPLKPSHVADVTIGNAFEFYDVLAHAVFARQMGRELAMQLQPSSASTRSRASEAA